MSSNVGVWSTSYDVINGQALVTKHVVEKVLPGICKARLYIFPIGGGFRAICGWIIAWSRLWIDVLFRRIPRLYLVCSRSNLGFLRDVPALLTSIAGLRVVVHVHGSDLHDLLTSRIVSPLGRFLYTRCDVVVASQHQARLLSPFVRKAILIENYMSAFRSDSGVLSHNMRGLSVLWNSNIMSTKGFFDLIDAARALQAEGMDIVVNSIGLLVPDAEMTAAELSERFKVVRKLSWFTYLGQVSQVRSVELLADADVVALPSVSEAQPVTIIEAMCFGRGVIIANLPTLLATVGDYPCEIVRPKAVTELTEALRRLHQEKAADPVAFFERRSGPGMAAKERFSVDRFNHQILHVVMEGQ